MFLVVREDTNHGRRHEPQQRTPTTAGDTNHSRGHKPQQGTQTTAEDTNHGRVCKVVAIFFRYTLFFRYALKLLTVAAKRQRKHQVTGKHKGVNTPSIKKALTTS
jgi:hypothetical protein